MVVEVLLLLKRVHIRQEGRVPTITGEYYDATQKVRHFERVSLRHATER